MHKSKIRAQIANSQARICSVDELGLLQQRPLRDDSLKVLSLANALAPRREAGLDVTLQGVVTASNGTFTSSTFEYGFAMQNASHGIYVAMTTPPSSAINIGCEVNVSGVPGELNKMAVVYAEPQHVNLIGNCSSPGEVTPLNVSTGSVGSANEGEIVTVEGNVTRVIDDQPYGYKVFIDDGSGEVQVFVNIIDGQPVVDLASLQVGQTVQVTGLSSRYEDTIEVMPRGPEDVRVLV